MEIKQYYEDLLDTFSTNGWKHFMEDMEKDVTEIDSLKGVSNYEDFMFRKGQLSILKKILAWETMTREAMENLDADNS